MTTHDETTDHLEELLMTYGKELGREATERQSRSWTRLRASLATLATPRRRAGWRLPGFARVLAAAAAGTALIAGITLTLAGPADAYVAAGRGDATVTVGGRTSALNVGDRVPVGAEVRTADGAWVSLAIGDDRVGVDQASRVVVSEIARLPPRIVIAQREGRTWNVLRSDPSRSFVVRTASGDVAARGTAFTVATPPNAPPEVAMAQGTVEVTGRTGTASVSAGQLLRLATTFEVEALPSTQVSSAAVSGAVDALGRTCTALRPHNVVAALPWPACRCS